MPFTLIENYAVLYAANMFVPRIWLRDSDGKFIGQLISTQTASPSRTTAW